MPNQNRWIVAIVSRYHRDRLQFGILLEVSEQILAAHRWHGEIHDDQIRSGCGCVLAFAKQKGQRFLTVLAHVEPGHAAGLL
jgi:hypothetical protein